MTFLWPGMLASLVLVPLLALIYLRVQRRRSRGGLVRFQTTGRPPVSSGSPGSPYSATALPEAQGALAAKTVAPKTTGPSGARRHVPAVLFLTGLAVLLAALARPQTVVSLPRVEGIVILAFDVSGSMAAEDMQPNRMDAAKAAAKAFVARQPSTVQVGVVSFSDNGFPVQAPTADQNLILAAIGRMGTQRGTSLANGIITALKSIEVAQAGDSGPLTYSNRDPQPTPSPTPVPSGTHVPAVIVLLSDGNNNEMPDPAEAAMLAVQRGVRIYTVGIGSPTGTTLKINGFNIHTQLNEGPLKQIAEMTGGSYFNAQSSDELLQVYDHLDPQLVVRPEMMEITALFAGAGVLILLVGAALSLLWFSRLP